MADKTTPAEVPEVDGITEDAAVQQILSRWKKPEGSDGGEKPAAEAEPEQPEGEAKEPEEAEEEAPADDGEVELDVGGKKFKAPKAIEGLAREIEAQVKQIEAGATRKFQEAAELRKATETERQAVAQMRKIAEANADLLADYRMVARRIEQLEGIDVGSTDTDTLTRLNAEYTRLQAAQRKIGEAYQASIKEMQAKEAEAMRARQEHAQKTISQRLKGWGPEMERELAEYAVGRGAPVEALQAVTEPWMVEILADAAYGRKMREHKSTIDKRVNDAKPTLRPGASNAQPAAQAKAKEAMQRLGKSHSVEDAAMALLTRSRAVTKR